MNAPERKWTPVQARLPADAQTVAIKFWDGRALNCNGDIMHSVTAMPKYIQAIERYLLDNPKLSKPALVELLTKRFPNLSAEEAWIIVSRYFNKKA